MLQEWILVGVKLLIRTHVKKARDSSFALSWNSNPVDNTFIDLTRTQKFWGQGLEMQLPKLFYTFKQRYAATLSLALNGFHNKAFMRMQHRRTTGYED